jgi:hypothetical protein
VSNYQPAPAGEIEVEIVAASIGEVAWKVSDENPKGECLRLRLRPAGNYAFVFCDVPLDWGRMLDAVRAATGVSGDMVPEELTGQRARVVLKHYSAKDGSTRATVAKWLPPSKSEPKQARQGVVKAAMAKVSRNAPPAFGADDDLPF